VIPLFGENDVLTRSQEEKRRKEFEREKGARELKARLEVHHNPTSSNGTPF